MALIRTFVLVHDNARRNAAAFMAQAPEGSVVKVSDPTRTSDQNAKFHAMCSDLTRSGTSWAGKPRTADQWKVLLVSGHAVATKEGAEVVPGLEGEFINIRESTASMSKRRTASLIEYTLAFCAAMGVELGGEE